MCVCVCVCVCVCACVYDHNIEEKTCFEIPFSHHGPPKPGLHLHFFVHFGAGAEQNPFPLQEFGLHGPEAHQMELL